MFATPVIFQKSWAIFEKELMRLSVQATRRLKIQTPG
jgi:hypothetical protein